MKDPFDCPFGPQFFSSLLATVLCRFLAVPPVSLRLALWGAFGYTAVRMTGETGTLASGGSPDGGEPVTPPGGSVPGVCRG